MTTGQIDDPYLSYNFHVEIDGISVASFQQASGFDSTIDLVEHREGGDNATMRKLPGMTKYSNIQLRKGVTDDAQLYQWHRRAIEGDIERKNGSIILLNAQGQEVIRWNFHRAWPHKYTGPELHAEKSDVAIEVLELAHEGVERMPR